MRELVRARRKLRSKLRQIQGDYAMLMAELDKQETRINDLETLHRASTLELEAATAAKSQFLANMSHEIRTPMNAVLGMAELLLHTQMSVRQQELAETIRSSGSLLLSLINDILDFSKIDAGCMELEQEPFELRDAIANSFALIAEPAQEKGLRLEYEVEPRTPARIVGDGFRLQQVLGNLLSNAVKFTSCGEVTLRAWMEDEVVADGSVAMHFEVRDTGIGIPIDRRERLFRAFSQVDASMTREFGGTGLGLAICQQIVEQMGGQIAVDDNPGGGSRFFFHIRATIAADERRDAEASALASVEVAPDQLFVEAETLATRHPLRILVAEDNPVNQRVLQLQLERLGYEPDIVGDGFGAVERALAHSYDLVLMDVQMPGLDGLSATREIRATLPKSHHPRIVALTAGAGVEERSACLDAGVDEFLTKPINQAILSAAIERSARVSLDSASVARALSTTPPG